MGAERQTTPSTEQSAEPFSAVRRTCAEGGRGHQLRQLRQLKASFEASPPYAATSFETSQKPAKPAKPVTATSLWTRACGRP